MCGPPVPDCAPSENMTTSPPSVPPSTPMPDGRGWGVSCGGRGWGVSCGGRRGWGVGGTRSAAQAVDGGFPVATRDQKRSRDRKKWRVFRAASDLQSKLATGSKSRDSRVTEFVLEKYLSNKSCLELCKRCECMVHEATLLFLVVNDTGDGGTAVARGNTRHVANVSGSTRPRDYKMKLSRTTHTTRSISAISSAAAASCAGASEVGWAEHNK
jgi:hypothetical protein